MIRGRYASACLFTLVPQLHLEFEPELAQLDRLLEDDVVFPQVRADLGLVVPNRDGGPLAENHVLVMWHRAVAKIALLDGTKLPKIRMHDLCHTKGTLMADEGEDTVVIQQIGRASCRERV